MPDPPAVQGKFALIHGDCDISIRGAFPHVLLLQLVEDHDSKLVPGPDSSQPRLIFDDECSFVSSIVPSSEMMSKTRAKRAATVDEVRLERRQGSPPIPPSSDPNMLFEQFTFKGDTYSYGIRLENSTESVDTRTGVARLFYLKSEDDILMMSTDIAITSGPGESTTCTFSGLVENEQVAKNDHRCRCFFFGLLQQYASLLLRDQNPTLIFSTDGQYLNSFGTKQDDGKSYLTGLLQQAGFLKNGSASEVIVSRKEKFFYRQARSVEMLTEFYPNLNQQFNNSQWVVNSFTKMVRIKD